LAISNAANTVSVGALPPVGVAAVISVPQLVPGAVLPLELMHADRMSASVLISVDGTFPMLGKVVPGVVPPAVLARLAVVLKAALIPE
jgi:hypothetical protein